CSRARGVFLPYFDYW
nr:immunoglobulin heavy chain junction region [Macaca mulatta]